MMKQVISLLIIIAIVFVSQVYLISFPSTNHVVFKVERSFKWKFLHRYDKLIAALIHVESSGNELAYNICGYEDPLWPNRAVGATASGVFSSSPLISDSYGYGLSYTSLRGSDASNLLSQMNGDFTNRIMAVMVYGLNRSRPMGNTKTISG